MAKEKDVPYLLLIVEPVDQRAGRTEAEGREAYDRMRRWGQSLQQRGLLQAMESLASQRHGARVERREGVTRVVDGPFAEAKEMVGGFFLLNVDRKEEAVRLAAECPAAEWCTVEVRPLAPCHDDSRA
jgi:hypothetical protein